MKKQLVADFIKDRINIILIFMLNTAVLILFFNVAPGTKKEIVYPMQLSLFMLVILITTEWFKYYKFNKNLYKLEDNFTQDLQPITREQKKIQRIKNHAYKKHSAEISEVLSQNKSKNYFLSQWIHTLKTPISVIELIIQKYSQEAEDTYKVLESISFENSRLYNSIEQVLTIIRLEDFEKDYEPQHINLVQEVKKILDERKRQFIYSNVFPRLEFEKEEMFIISDIKWNELMIDQIISNAIKYSQQEDEEKNIYIKIFRKENDVLLSIRDEGIGIAEYDIKRVFEPFFTGENGRLYKNSTGIGLYVCSEIAKKLQHQIEIKSEPSKGSEVIIKYITKL